VERGKTNGSSLSFRILSAMKASRRLQGFSAMTSHRLTCLGANIRQKDKFRKYKLNYTAMKRDFQFPHNIQRLNTQKFRSSITQAVVLTQYFRANKTLLSRLLTC